MFGKIKNALGKVKEFFLEAKIEEKTKTTLDEGIAAVKKSSEELVEKLGKVSEAAAKNHENLKDTVGRVVDAVKNKPADIKETEKIIDDASKEHVNSDLSKDMGLTPICSNTATSDALKEADKIRKEKIVKKSDCKDFKKKCEVDEVAAEKSVEATVPTYIRGTFKKVELTRMQEAIDSGNPYDTTFIAKELNRDPLSIAKKMKQLAATKTEA